MTLDEAIKHCEEVASDYSDAKKIHTRNHGFEKSYKCEMSAKEHRQLAVWLKKLKQLREQTRWIPVSEELPKVADCYDVTRQIGSDLIVSACYFDGINWHNGNRISYERNYLTNVVAWMPRPEPYKAEEEEV